MLDVFLEHNLVTTKALADGIWLFKLPGSPCPSWARWAKFLQMKCWKTKPPLMETLASRGVWLHPVTYIYIHISLQVVQSSFPAGGHFWCSQAFLARMQRKLLSGLHHKPEICVQKGFCLNDHSIQAFTKLCAKAEVQCAGLCCSDLSWQVCKLWWLIIWSRNQVPCAFTWFLIRVNRILCETGARRVMVRIE